MQIKGIAYDTLNFLLEASKSMDPEKFGGLLQEKDGIIIEVLILPGTECGETNVVLKLFMMPNINAVGSIHSHPSLNHKPSKADLQFFSNTGNCHIIVCRPYDKQSWTCYDREGNIRELPVLNVEYKDLQRTDIEFRNIQIDNFEEYDLKRAYIENADFKMVNLKRANLEEADLKGANLTKANLYEADLKRANLEEADLKGDNLTKANLCEADLKRANLKKTDLKEANLEGTNLVGANLEKANLQWAYLKGVNLKGADLQEADLKDAYLREANLEKANLEKADLKEARNLSIDQLFKVKTLYNTKLDKEFLMPLKEKYPALFEKPD